MFEYLIVLSAVAIAVWFVGRRLWRDAQNKGCDGCSCKYEQLPNRLIQIKPIDRKKY
ncbi:MAG: FeoB-associated Cys-rich membrane protein [FCB group bacterium]|nr:FeoB-associated Cys-rich membrane protein [FCB group bacterium]